MTIREKANKKREEFIQRRTLLEQKINNWFQQFQKTRLYNEIKDEIPFEELTFQSICPEAYAVDPSQEIYDKQEGALKSWAAKVNQRINEFLEEMGVEVED